MKRVFVFNDSRITDLEPTFVMLTEEGTPFMKTRFTSKTAPFFMYALNLLDDCPAMSDADVHAAVLRTRGDVRMIGDLLFGAENWKPEFLAHPMEVEEFRIALDKAHERQRTRVDELKAQRADATLEALLGLLAAFDMPGEPVRTTH